MAIDIAAYKTRIIAMMEAAVSGSQGLPYAIANRDTYPYFTLQLSATPSVQQDPTHSRYDVTCLIRLKRNRLTAGYEGDVELQCDVDVFTVVLYFNNRKNLTLAPGDNPITGFIPRSLNIRGETTIFGEAPHQELGSLYTLTFAIGDRSGA